MARIPINYGTTAGDGTGDILFTSFKNINDNFIEVYNERGWGYYQDDETFPIVLTTTPQIITINGLSAGTDTDYLPKEIRGISDLWDVSTNKITPISIGDSYDLRIDLGILSKTGAPTIIEIVLDIGVGAGITIPIVRRDVSTDKVVPFDYSVGFGTFSKATFLANGGRIFASVDSGTLTLDKRAVFIKRDYKGQL